MNSVAFLLATSLLGVDYQVTDIDGELTYVIRIEEAIAQELVNGFTVSSTIPAEHSDLRRIKIEIVGESQGENREFSPPSLIPDQSIVPESTESIISAEINLEPEVFAFPNLRTNQSHKAAKTLPSAEVIPAFDPQTQKTDPSDLTNDDLVKSATSFILIPEESATDTTIPNPSQSGASQSESNDLDQTDGSSKTPPDLIKTHQDEFIALASTSGTVSKPKSPSPDAAEESASLTLLLPLLFSITLNCFLVFHVIQRWRT